MQKRAEDYIDDVLPLTTQVDIKEGRFFPIVKVVIEPGQRYPELKAELVELLLERLRLLIPGRDISPSTHMQNHDGWGFVFMVERSPVSAD